MKQTVKEIKQAFKGLGVVMQPLTSDENFLGALINISKYNRVVATKIIRSVDVIGGLKNQHDCVLWILDNGVELSY